AGTAAGLLARLLLDAAQLHAANLAGDGLGQIGELEAADALVGAEASADEFEDVARQFLGGLDAGLADDERLGHRPANGVWAGHYRGFGDGGVLDGRALQLEGTQPVIGTLEHVVGAA